MSLTVALLKKCFDKFCKLYEKSLCSSHFLTSCRPRSYNFINTERPAQVLSSDFCKISQNSLLQNNREQLPLGALSDVMDNKISRNQQFIIRLSKNYVSLKLLRDNFEEFSEISI